MESIIVGSMKQLLILFCPLFLLVNTALAEHCGTSVPIIQKPIIFDKKRLLLTQEYRRQHYGIDSESIKIVPQMIVLHWTNSKSLKISYDYFNAAELKERQPELFKAGSLNVSAHFLVDRDGKIYQLMPTDWMARHVIGLNNVALAIENIGGVKDVDDLTEQQVKANAYLVCVLKQQYPTIQYVIGHFQYLKFKDTPLWKEKNKNYKTVKFDPGARFMGKVQKIVKKTEPKLKFLDE